MADKPILFSAPMICALLDGRKTQTRRVLKPAKPQIGETYVMWPVYTPGCSIVGRWHSPDRAAPHFVGDRLWVRETWHSIIGYDARPPRDIPEGTPIYYCAGPHSETAWAWGRSRPSMFMPRWASRLTLIVTDVRVQRLQEISEADAWHEGVWNCGEDDGGRSLGEGRELFENLWASINGPGSWDENPWVAAYSFRVIRANIDSAGAQS